MPFDILPRITSPDDVKRLNPDESRELAGEIREALCNLVSLRAAHFASNLGVVELCIALHQVFDFSKDRLIWDTGHQIYPHKLVTGRFDEFHTIRQQGGLMGYPNPAESDYDLFVTGHAGASLSTVLGLQSADALLRPEEGRKAVAVIGDGALPSGIVFEAMNNAAGMNSDMLVVLNDNGMGICPRVGGLASYLDKARVAPFYNGLKRDVSWILNKVPGGQSVESVLASFKDAVKGFLHGGMLFEEMGFRYIGPVDGHDLDSLRRYLDMVKDVKGPVLLHVFTEKGHGFEPALADPVKFHTPPPFERDGENQVVAVKSASKPAYTNVVSDAIHDRMTGDENVVVLTAAMCAGNKLGRIRDDFPKRFFDVGICESHAVAFAGGMAKAGARPIVDIYSTFLQRSFDQIFQEVSLQNLPVVFCMDRSGLCGPDGPTHHGVFDIAYTRMFPNMVVMAPGDAADVEPMLDFALQHDTPTSLRYPKANAETIDRDVAPLELGKAEVLRWGTDGTILSCGTMLSAAVEAADRLQDDGLDVGVVNARFVKPLDTEVLARAITDTGFVITLEEGVLSGGFGSAVLEAANAAGLPTNTIHRIGIPDAYVEHGDRADLLADLDLDADGIVRTAMDAVGSRSFVGE